jgi:hypothetical protein
VGALPLLSSCLPFYFLYSYEKDSKAKTFLPTGKPPQAVAFILSQDAPKNQKNCQSLLLFITFVIVVIFAYE